eukprot:TRINITY_DN21082_c0_g2_i4.p3 TRINITY_DN21082_c0_g2~~TRINITY_DN21082_c0_g2_i4.p3  ORF type:complete len:233 (+),score=-11.62 TRINITY_DN21082_c0_g2_i4:369-1067(+)
MKLYSWDFLTSIILFYFPNVKFYGHNYCFHEVSIKLVIIKNNYVISIKMKSTYVMFYVIYMSICAVIQLLNIIKQYEYSMVSVRIKNCEVQQIVQLLLQRYIQIFFNLIWLVCVVRFYGFDLQVMFVQFLFSNVGIQQNRFKVLDLIYQYICIFKFYILKKKKQIILYRMQVEDFVNSSNQCKKCASWLNSYQKQKLKKKKVLACVKINQSYFMFNSCNFWFSKRIKNKGKH